MRIYRLRGDPTDYAIIEGTVCRRAWDPAKGRPSADSWAPVWIETEHEVLRVAREERRRGSWWSRAGR